MRSHRIKEKKFGSTRIRTAVLNPPQIGPIKKRGTPNLGCWYFEDIVVCPMCKAEVIFRSRRMPPKPVLTEERYYVTVRYCGCSTIHNVHHIRLPDEIGE